MNKKEREDNIKLPKFGDTGSNALLENINEYGVAITFAGQYDNARRLLIDSGCSAEVVNDMSEKEIEDILSQNFIVAYPALLNGFADLRTIILIPRDTLGKYHCLTR